MTNPSIFQKACNQCKEMKPWDEFYKHKTSSDKLHPTCKECVRRRSNEWRKRAVANGRYRLTTNRYRKSEKGQASIQKYEMKESSRAKRHASSRAWYLRNRERLGIKPRSKMSLEEIVRSRRNSTLKRKYKITSDEYGRLYDGQSGLCAICGSPPSGQGKNSLLAVDHDHVTGSVRGLLCHKCNSGIGLLNDDPILLQKAYAYLRAPEQD